MATVRISIFWYVKSCGLVRTVPANVLEEPAASVSRAWKMEAFFGGEILVYV
jgi:hypothetical protein